MVIKMVDLAKEYPLKGGRLICYIADEYVRPALIVVPGGGYGFVSPREGEPIALEFLARGYHCFVLEYVIGGEAGASYPEQLLELASAVDYVKKNAREFRVNADMVYAVGASAGGHLIGSLAITQHKIDKIAHTSLNCKLTAIGLMYPVVSKIDGHQGSYNNLLYGYSEEEKIELLKTLNLNEGLTENAPPAFIFTTATDQLVPASNALRYALACSQMGVPYELHVYPYGRHGLSTGKAEVNEGMGTYCLRLSNWLDDCDAFFRYCAKRVE